MAYTAPAFNAVSVDLKPAGSPAVVIPAFNVVNVDLSTEDGGGGGAVEITISDNARLRNFSILLAI